MTVLGLGHDVVDVVAFNDLLVEPGSRMTRAFSTRERRQCAMRAQGKHDAESVHLAARWAGKEAAFKAWCEALGTRPYPYGLDDVPWAGIEVLDDSRGCPHIVLAREVEEAWRTSMGGGAGPGEARWRVSLSHDGPVASAVVVIDG